MKFVLEDVATTLASRLFPTVTLWNRLEGRPRADKFDRALKAEVRDALWMLTKQWQLGEFRGDDAGSPIETKVHLTSTSLRKYQPDTHAVEPFDDDTPLEADVERRAIAFKSGQLPIGLDLRLLMGRHWIKLLRAALAVDLRTVFAEKYPIHAPDPAQQQDAIYCAHPEVWSLFAAAANGRTVDGAAVYEDIVDNPLRPAWADVPAIATNAAIVDGVAASFKAWFEKLIFQPEENDAWVPERLEYRFSASAPVKADGSEKVYLADEYYQGHLDWYSVDVDPNRASLGPVAPDPELPKPQTLAMVPVPVSFNGMPNTRWWAFEDGRTNFGDVKPETTDLAKLLLIEFGLTFANDWFLIPFTVPAGSVAKVQGMAVTNVFGERTWIEAAGRGPDDDWQRWAMFVVNTRGEHGEQADTSLLLLPTAPKVQEGRPLEEVMLARDEVANMVWGIEQTIPLPSGEPKRGREASLELRAFLERGVVAQEPIPYAGEALIRYRVMSSVPEHWIPFVPVHMDAGNREIQLQRAAMPRIIIGNPPPPPRKIRPRTSLLRHGLDIEPPALPFAYFLHEEEVLRAGTVVTKSFQRTRWRDGRVWVWLGVRKKTGRGETSSGLAFDRIVTKSQP
ncbi:MAG TPA: hypothetical protein VH394_23605 [Thermoanaerobaculia bacterium]|jgi:hypothetical protein|nr:hypothetical protein [Thermoanaerobaculia bacterium]